LSFLLFTDYIVSEMPEDGLMEGWQLKFTVDDRCVISYDYYPSNDKFCYVWFWWL